MTDLALAPIVAVFTVPILLTLLFWATWVVLNLWLWQKTKATANMLMLVGAGVLALQVLMLFFNEALGGEWLHVIALGVLTVGFFLSVRVQIEAQLAKLRERLHNVTAKKDAPPPAAK